MSTTETESAIQDYVPFTPFQEGYAFEAEPSRLEFHETEAFPSATPFIAEYAGVEAGPTPEAADLRELLFELYDEEFDAAIGQLAQEAWSAANDRAEVFGETVGAGTAEQFLEQWAAPVREQAEAMVDNYAQAIGEHDVVSMTESELDTFLERLEPRGTGLEPYFEDFLGGLAKKIGSFAKKAVAVAKKGLTLIPGIGAMIGKLKALVRPLLDRVLKMALDKLPPQLRPVAKQLAQKLLGKVASEAEAEDYAAPAVPDVGSIQQQFDLDVATLLFVEETEQEVIVTEALYEAERTDGAPLAELHEARARFVDELERGVDPQEALENFIPAVMAVLPIARTVIGVIGRQRVVNFLAGYLAKMIGRYVPPEASTQLSRAIVDTGLRMMSLEAPTEGEVQGLAPAAIAATVEDTVRRLMEADESTLEHQATLEVATTIAFQEAAAENFPPQLIVPELHEATVDGTWVAMPLKGRKYYKKYTRIFDVQITPQMADSLKTFGGTTIAAFLKDKLGVTAPVQARVHLYQAMSGTSPARIARLEKDVRGLGTAAKTAWVQLHPLSPRAAGMLLQQPKLGRRMPGRFRSTRRRIAVGQRFYYLEIPGARPAAAATATNGAQAGVKRSSEANLTLDFPKDEFRVFLYLSEADSQEIAGKLRNRDVTAALVAAKRIYEAGVTTALAGDVQRHVKIVSEALPQEQFTAVAKQLADAVKGQLTKKVVGWVGKAVADYVGSRAGELVTATEDPADGATVVVKIVSPPGAPVVRKLLKGELNPAQLLGDVGSIFKGDPKLEVTTVAGFRFD